MFGQIKLAPINILTSRRIAIATIIAITVLLVIDLFATRQILYLNNVGQTALFIVTVSVGYGIGPWILLEYTRRVTRELSTKSLFVRMTNLGVTITQFSLLGILLYVIYDDLVNCPNYFSLCTTSRLPIDLVYAISTIGACVILSFLAVNFLYRYRSNRKNFIVLLYGLAAAALAISISGDAVDKLFLLHVVEERSPTGVLPQSSYIYETFAKYHGEVEYKVVNPQDTRLYVVSSQNLSLYNEIIYWTSDAPYLLAWGGTFLLLRYYYKRTGKLNLQFWLILLIPIALYLVGSGLIFSLPANIPYKFYYRLVFRAGTIGSSVLFGLAFYLVSKKLPGLKIRDYLALTAMGIVPIGIANEISALQQTYGITSHSFVLLASYLFTIGLYSLVISISQDSTLRKSIRSSAFEISKLADIVEGPAMRQEIERRVLNGAREQEEFLTKQTGIQASLTEHEMKQYLGSVLKEIKILQNVDDILKKGKEILESSLEFLVCSRFGGLRLIYNNYFDLFTEIMAKHKDRKHRGIRMVTSIMDKDTAELTRKFLNIGVNVRHTKNMPPIDFSVSDKEMIATIAKSGDGGQENIKSLLVSNEFPYITHFVSIFEELWKEGTDALHRIMSIEEGIVPETFEVITDPLKASSIVSELAKSVKREAILLLPSVESVRRIDRLGIIDDLIEASRNGASVRIISPVTEENSDIVRRMNAKAPNIKTLNGHGSGAGFLIVDREKLFRAELKENSAEQFSEAIGFTLYSNSKRSVESFRSIFELLWNERMINEQLQRTDELQKEFIHIAAHELRNPIQPILGLSEVMRSKVTDPEHVGMLDVTIRNARRLRRLTEDILDVSKIESQMPLQLNKEKFNLNEFLVVAVSDFKDEISKDSRYKTKFVNSSIYMKLVSPEFHTININADKSRINQVIVNLLSNAVKFTEQGSIVITANRTDDGFVVITVEDEGTGIDPEIKPRLFTKFTTRSISGTGLGLFISKAIILAHGGKIWADNNRNGKGASFSFSIPLTG